MLKEQAPKLEEKKNGVKGTEVVLTRNPGSIIWTKVPAITTNRARKRKYKSSKALVSWEKTSSFCQKIHFCPKRTLSPGLDLRTWTVSAITALREHGDTV